MSSDADNHIANIERRGLAIEIGVLGTTSQQGRMKARETILGLHKSAEKESKLTNKVPEIRNDVDNGGSD